MRSHQYHVNVSWNTDRKGIMCSPELKSGSLNNGCIEVATPPQFPKRIEGIWSPDHLFTAAVASYFVTTFLAIAENSTLEFSVFTCDSKGTLDQLDATPAMKVVELNPTVVLNLRVLEKTESASLITNSIKGKAMIYPKIK